jgi:tetratricopeptide (TPR) repeat protein
MSTDKSFIKFMKVERVKKTKAFCLVAVLAVSALLLSTVNAWAVSEEAQRHFDRGVAAVEMAKSPDDYAISIKEFEQAKRLAPDWPDVYYNLGMVQEKAEKYSDAITSLKQYLRLAPNASDAATVKSLINKLEFKAEQEITKEVALDIFGSLSDSTKWRFVGESSAYKNWVKGLRRDGDRILITYIYDIRKGTTSTSATEPQGKTFALKYIICFFKFCGQDCDVCAQYIFKIVSKNKVQVEAVEVWPKIAPIEQKTERLTFEYIRIF